MRLTWPIGALLPLTLAACDGAVDPKLVSTAPAAPQQFASSQRAAALCQKHAPNWRAAEVIFKAAGFVDSADPLRSGIAKSQRSAILDTPASDVVVQIGSRGGEGACIVGLPGMTAGQSLALAGPWVRHYGAVTNAERGQGLAANAAQAWGALEPNRIVYIAAYRTWDVLDEPGASARLLYISR